MAIRKGVPAYLQLRDQFARAIAAGQWRADEAIPTEAELAARHGVAVGTVRKAIDGLVLDGLLQRLQGRGTFVRRPEFSSSLLRFFRFVGPDGELAHPSGKILARDVMSAPEAVAKALKLRAGSKVIRLVRLREIAQEPILNEEIFLPRARFRALLTIPQSEMGDLLYPLYERVCGEIVVRAQETLTIDIANETDKKLLRAKSQDPVIVIKRLALDLDGAGLEFRTTRGKASGFAYKIEIT